MEAADLKDVMGGIASEGADVARGAVPVRSGRLRKAIKGNRAKAKAVVTAGSARVKYAGPLNYGWARRRIKAKKFMQRADVVMSDRAPAMLEKGLIEAMRKAGLDG